MIKNSLKFGLLFFILFFNSCGYKATTSYTTPFLGDVIYTEVEIDVANPIDSVFLKDALNEAVISVFNAKIGDKENFKSSFKLKVKSVSISTIDYDKNGYPILYRSKASIKAEIVDIEGVYKTYSASGSYDFSIDRNAVLSDDIKHNAIKESFVKALQMIEFKIAQKGIKNNDNKSNK